MMNGRKVEFTCGAYGRLFVLLLSMFFAPAGIAQLPAGLPAVLQAVLENNPAVKGKQAEVQARGFAVESAKTARFPSLTGQVDTVGDSDGQAAFRLQQPLWAFGKIDTNIDLSEAELQFEQLDLFKVKRELLEQASVAYARIETLRNRQVIARENIAAHESLYEQIRRREEGMLASETDVRLAYSRFLQASASLQQLDGEFAAAVADLEVLTLAKVGSSEPIDTGLLSLMADTDWSEQLQYFSPELQQKHSRIAILKLARDQQQLAATPTLYLRAEHDIADSGSVDDDSRLGLVLEGSLDGFGFASRARTKGAAARLEAAQRDLEATRNDVLYRFDRLLINRRSLISARLIQEEALVAVEGTAASFYRQYVSGRKSWLDVLNTQRELVALQNQLEQTRGETRVVSLRIAAALGRLDAIVGVSKP